MTEKELQKLNRRRLLELLLIQTERADNLEAELEKTGRKLRNKLLWQKESGSIAEAALKLNGVFEAADAAAAQYLENIRISSEYQDKLREDAEAEARATVERAKKEAEEIRLEAQGLLDETERICAERTAECDELLRAARLLYEYLSTSAEITRKGQIK